MNRTEKLPKLAIYLIALIMFISFPLAAQAKDKIVIGAARPLSGVNAFFEANAFGPIYKMWVDEVNAEGGIYVKEYGKKLPVEMLVYDSKSEMGTMTRLLDKLILKDKVDFIFPPVSTAFLFAASAIANRHGMVLIGAEGGASSLKEVMKSGTMPYFFMVLPFADHFQMPVLAEVFQEMGVKSAGISFIEDLHGIEYSGMATKEFNRRGIEIKMFKSLPMDLKDVSPILKQAQRLNVDAYCSFTYPPITFPTVLTAQAIGYNPKAMMLGPGGNFEVIKNVVGADTVEGIIGEGAWNAKSSPAHADFVKKYTARYPYHTLDWWGHNVYYAALQVLKQATERAGTLNQKKIRDVIATQTFDTILGPTRFENQLLVKDSYAGQIGQWQNGIFEVIDPGPKRTAAPVYPKPKWPAPKPKK
jgi:branched-chain amino acid transport system substrate-binding protein